jgi:flagellin
MGLRINQNVAAFNAYRNLSVTDGQMARSLEKLSSGFRINRAADDAAGLSISENLRSKVGGFKVAMRNAQDAISLVQTAEGALNEVHSLLQRVRDLAVQSANTGANDSDSRTAAQTEVTAALAEIDRIAQATVYGSKQLLLTDSTSFTFQVGASGEAFNQLSVTINSMTTAGLSINSLSVSSGGTAAIATVDAAIAEVSTQRSNLGAVQNRLEHTLTNLGVSVENLAASESRIRDTDMALEMTEFTRAQILSQAGTAMLAQANAAPQSVLALLRGTDLRAAGRGAGHRPHPPHSPPG